MTRRVAITAMPAAIAMVTALAAPAMARSPAPTPQSAAPQQSATPQQSAAIDAIFARFNTPDSAGCALDVMRNGQSILARAWGMADLEHAIPATPASIYEAGSVSKQFAAAAIILLARDGRLSLNDDIRKYLPEMPDYGTAVTVGDLIHHMSGLRDWGSVAGMSGWPRNSRTATNDDVLALAAQQKGLNYAPGTHYTYSNTNFNLAAVIVARITGQSFAAFTEQRIFQPLGMRNSHWREHYQTVVPGRATAYARQDGAYIIDQPIEDAHGNGGLLTTVADLSIWNTALDTDRLGPGFTTAMEQAGILRDGTRIDYAAGLRWSTWKGVTEIAHSGSTGGYRAWLARYPAQKLSVALLCNADDAAPVDTGHAVADIFLTGLRPDPAYKPKSVPAGGLYVSTVTGMTVQITPDNGGLAANGATLNPVAKDRWRRGDTDYVFDAKGGLVIETTGERLPHLRVAPVTTVDTAPYAGRYCGTDNDFCIIVTRSAQGALVITPSSRPGLAPEALKPAFADAFTVAGRGTMLRFTRDDAGKITALRYLDGRAFGVLFNRTD